MAENGTTTFKRLDYLQDRKNIVPKKDISGIMVDTLEELREILRDHCGPYGLFCMIHDEMQPDQPPKFTKDGINILRSVDYFNPMQKIMRDEIAHIGKSIERSAGDGTTSAMLTTISAALEMVDSRFMCEARATTLEGDIKDEQYRLSDAMTFETFRQHYFGWMHDILNEWRAFIYTWEDIYRSHEDLSKADAIWLVAFWQAMCSSHGDDTLSRVAADTFTRLPQEAWSNITFIREEIETEERIKLEENTDQYSLQATPFTNAILNKSAGTEFEQEDCTLIVLNSTLTSNDPVSNEALRQVEECSQNGIPAVVVCPGGVDQMMASKLEKSLGSETAIFTTPVNEPRFNDLMGLQCVAGLERADTVDNVKPVKGCHIKYANRELIINGIYGVTETYESMEHPDVHDSSTVLYRTLEEISQTIEKMEEQENDPKSIRELRNLKRLYNKIRYRHNYQIRIGGSVRDNAQTVDLITDALLAVKNTLLHGFTMAGNLDLLKTVYRSERNCSTTAEEKFSYIFEAACIDMLRGTVVDTGRFPDIMDSLDGGANFFIRPPGSKLSIDKVRENSINRYLEGQDVSEEHLSIQPSTIEPEILRKFGDVMLKYLYTCRIVAPGCIYEGEEEEEQEEEQESYRQGGGGMFKSQ